VREAKSSTPRAATPTPGREAATAAALRTHARTPCTCILRWVHNAHLQKRDAEVGNRYAGFLSWLEHRHFACAPHTCSNLSRQSPETNTVWERWSAVTHRRAALRARGRNYWPSLSYEAGLGQLEPLRAQLQHGASSAWSAVESENLEGLLGD
jgi:hypothetical protein